MNEKYNIDKVEGEEWRDVRFFEHRYMVSNYGRVFSKLSNKVLKLTANKYGSVYAYFSEPVRYLSGKVRMMSKSYEVGYLVAMAFKRSSHLNERKVTHLDGNKSNNHYKNLVWSD